MDAADGSAVVEFALVSVIALTVALALIQLALFMWQRNVVMTALSDGARVAATSGRDAAEGREAACALLEQTLGDGCARVSVTAVAQDGVVVVTGRGELPSFVPIVPDIPLRLVARMHDEDDLFAPPPAAQGGTP
jgi:Flp pilus assembly protein TadG